MEQAKRTRPHLERVLIVCGEQNAGKSHILRDIFIDPRMGTNSVIPSTPRISAVRLSQERCLAFRITSPHETGQTLTQFLNEIDRAMKHEARIYWRFNYACALQPHAANRMPDAVDTVKQLRSALVPERIRIAQINPRQDGTAGNPLTPRQIDALRKMGVEYLTIDGRRAPNLNPNGFLLADFFDFS